MQKFFILIAIFFIHSYAIDLQIKLDSNLSVSSKEIDQMIEMFKKRRLIIDKKDAKNAVFENRLLANTLIKEKISEIPEALLVDIKLAIEENFAELYINKKQESINLSDDTIASYYYTHKKDFYNPIVHITTYSFNTFSEAALFYEKSYSNIDKINLISQELNATENAEKIELSKMSTTIKSLLKDTTTTNYITLPISLSGKILILYIRDIQDNYHSLQDSKEKIRHILLKEVFRTTRNDLLKELKGQK